jgi:long-chain acyl-CoA synthetase
MANISNYLQSWIKKYGDRPALESADGNVQISYNNLERLAEIVSINLANITSKPQSIILLFMEACPNWMVSFFGILGSHNVVIPIPDNLGSKSIQFIAMMSNAKVVISSDKTIEQAKIIKGVTPYLIEDLLNEKALSRKYSLLPVVQPSDTALISFTSGSTQTPRAVELSHANILSDLNAFLEVRRPGSEDIFLSMLPPSHLFELVAGQLTPLSCGSKIIYSDSMMPNRIIQSIREKNITYALVVPGLLKVLFMENLEELIEGDVIQSHWENLPIENILNQLHSKVIKDNLYYRHNELRTFIGKSLKAFFVGGAALHPALAEICNSVGIDVEVGYGLSEASPGVSMGSTLKCPANSVGKPLPGVQVKISNENEVIVKGPNVMKGYYLNPQQTEEVLKEGWLHTGDIGYMDDQGHLYITGRLKEAMVTESGETIYPDEVEPYYHHPLFVELCVVPLSDSIGNDRPTLVVVASSSKITKEEITQTFRELRNKAPEKCRVTNIKVLTMSLPRTEIGKIKRKEIAKLLSREEGVQNAPR